MWFSGLMALKRLSHSLPRWFNTASGVKNVAGLSRKVFARARFQGRGAFEDKIVFFRVLDQRFGSFKGSVRGRERAKSAVFLRKGGLFGGFYLDLSGLIA